MKSDLNVSCIDVVMQTSMSVTPVCRRVVQAPSIAPTLMALMNVPAEMDMKKKVALA